MGNAKQLSRCLFYKNFTHLEPRMNIWFVNGYNKTTQNVNATIAILLLFFFGKKCNETFFSCFTMTQREFIASLIACRILFCCVFLFRGFFRRSLSRLMLFYVSEWIFFVFFGHMASTFASLYVWNEIKVNSPLHLDQLLCFIAFKFQGFLSFFLFFPNEKKINEKIWFEKIYFSGNCEEVKKRHKKNLGKKIKRNARKWVWRTQQWTKHLSRSDNKMFYTFSKNDDEAHDTN